MPSLTSNYQKSTRKNIYAVFVLLVWLIFVTWLISNRQNIYDWWKLRGYSEPASISQLATQDTMTSYAQKVYKVNKPQILGKADFNKHCPNNGGEQTIVLGCYHSNQQGIFLLSESDTRLNGVEQVTAAHEMLHAAYDRLSSSEKKRVDAMLLDYYDHHLHDQRLFNTFAAYRKTEPKDVVNEMHSIFGTEVANLTPQLEQYYKKYFTNRKVISSYAASYQEEFTSRQNLIDQDKKELNQLKPQLDNLQSDLTNKLSSINSLQSQLAQLRNSGNIAAYNNGVPSYNSLIDSYNSEVAQIKTLSATYNSIVNEVNSAALSANQLYQELSGNQSTINR